MALYHPKYAGKRKRKKSKLHKFIIYTLALLIIAALVVGYLLYRVIYHPNVWLNEEKEVSVYIPTGSNFEDVKSILYSHGTIINRKNFEWLAKKKNYPQNVKPGHYLITEGMNNDQLINMLRAGQQEPVKVIFNNINTKAQLAGRISRQLEADSTMIHDLLADSTYLAMYDLTPKLATMIFIPNTYEFYWNTDANAFIERMHNEFEKFWNKERKQKADSIGLNIPKVITLASIVEKETNKNDEKPIIAGVYMNRLNKGWLLQADPTLIFAIGDYNIRRVLDEHKEIESEYNTYKHGGLPPGPICIPSISSIEAVLNYDDNDYFYFCAKDDLSGYHSFAKTHRQHTINAKKYREALNKQKIFR